MEHIPFDVGKFKILRLLYLKLERCIVWRMEWWQWNLGLKHPMGRYFVLNALQAVTSMKLEKVKLLVVSLNVVCKLPINIDKRKKVASKSKTFQSY